MKFYLRENYWGYRTKQELRLPKRDEYLICSEYVFDPLYRIQTLLDMYQNMFSVYMEKLTIFK